MKAKSARFYTLLSILAAIVTIALKYGAYKLTGSVGLLSDALESIINLVTALFAFWAVSFAAKPPDEQHQFGHNKAEYFSSGLESALIVVAAISIAIAAGQRLLAPQPIENADLGLLLSVIASAINGGVAWTLLRAGKRLRSITLKADAHHLLTDVWTSVGVVIGIFLVKLTGWLVLDPIIALLVALNIIWAGFQLLKETGSGLLDTSIPQEEVEIVRAILSSYDPQGILFHALRSRVAGSRRFITFHVLVPGNWTVQRGHSLCEEIEMKIIDSLPGSVVITHLEPKEDESSWQDQGLDR